MDKTYIRRTKVSADLDMEGSLARSTVVETLGPHFGIREIHEVLCKRCGSNWSTPWIRRDTLRKTVDQFIRT